MSLTVAIIYNQPSRDRYSAMGEEKAVLGVLEEAAAVQKALQELGHTALPVPFEPPLDGCRARLREIEADLIFNLFEGFAGSPETEAQVAEYLSELGILFTGCPAPALSLALDKPKTKELLLRAGIRTPAYQVLAPRILSDFRLSFPCIVKPQGEDASHGLTESSIVSDFTSLAKEAARVSGLFGGQALVEEFIDGREFNATVLSNSECMVLPIAEIIYTIPASKPRILTFGSKWEPRDIYFHNTNARCPADIDERLREQIMETARAAFQLIVRRGYARVDMRLDAGGEVNVLEVNPNPDISPSAGAARQARAAGMTYPQFIEKICRIALERK